MDNKEFFNSVAFKWDDMCKHDEVKVRKIIDMSSIKSNANILDIGTGTGVLIKYLLEKNPLKVTGLDLSENMIAVAREKYKDNRVEFVAKDIMEFDQKGFDYIFIYSAYPHFKNKEALFNHLFDILSPGGSIIIAHSDSKEKINKVHSKNDNTKCDILLPAEVTIKTMSKYFKADQVIDNENMYYISAVKK